MCKIEEFWTGFRRLRFVRICLWLVLDLVELGFPPSLTRVQRYACTAPSIRDLCHLYVDPMRFLLALAWCYTRPTGSGGLSSLPKLTQLQVRERKFSGKQPGYLVPGLSCILGILFFFFLSAALLLVHSFSSMDPPTRRFSALF